MLKRATASGLFIRRAIYFYLLSVTKHHYNIALQYIYIGYVPGKKWTHYDVLSDRVISVQPHVAQSQSLYPMWRF